jgi:hypothetical protein
MRVEIQRPAVVDRRYNPKSASAEQFAVSQSFPQRRLETAARCCETCEYNLIQSPSQFKRASRHVRVINIFDE